eukprot:tig00000670_g3040.t1
MSYSAPAMLHGNAGYSVIQPGMAGPPGRKRQADKATGSSSGYGFVDFYDHTTAGLALQALNGRYVYGYDLKVNWAFAGGQREDTSGHFHIFVGDLSSGVDDRALFGSFQQFGSISPPGAYDAQAAGAYDPQTAAAYAAYYAQYYPQYAQYAAYYAAAGAGDPSQSQGPPPPPSK